MNSILSEISLLRKGAPLVIDNKNSNRYRVVTFETNGSKTAYYFSAPIYNSKTRKAVDMKFYSKNESVYLTGSNATVTITKQHVRMENAEGSCVISLSTKATQVSDHEMICGTEQISPTTNGIAIKSSCLDGKPYTFSIETSTPFWKPKVNDKYFALMSGKFRPFVSISCIGTLDKNENIIAPAKLTYQKIADRKYTLTITPSTTIGKAVLIEANLYEPKLFQDTTVESFHPTLNNAFGSIGFIGTTKEFGEQWLYTRPDFSKMTELNDKKILHAILHLPTLNNAAMELTTSKVAARFCSFGSTWDNKMAETSSLSNSEITDFYIDLDLTSMLSDKYGRLAKGEGFILKAKKEYCGYSVIATGDNCFKPQILEINYK